MLNSIAMMFLFGMLLAKLFDKLNLPRLVGMLVTGFILGPYALNLLDGTIIMISSELRQLALVIILIRAGLNLDLGDLKHVGRPALLLSFIPAIAEIAAISIITPLIFDISWIDAVLVGTVLAAVSPAIIVPRMLKLKELRLGTSKLIPQLIMAGASVDDVIVIVLFTSTLSLSLSGTMSGLSIIQLPISLLSGIVFGTLLGWALAIFFQRFHLRDTGKVMIILSLAFLLLTLEKFKMGFFSFSGLIAIMLMAATIQVRREHVAKRLSHKFSKLWMAAEVLLFVLVGAQVSWSSLSNVGLGAIVVVFFGLMFRSLGVFFALHNIQFSFYEKVFIALAYIPKATVQAAIGGIALSVGHPKGELILSLAVLSILISAPLGAWLIDTFAPSLLVK